MQSYWLYLGNIILSLQFVILVLSIRFSFISVIVGVLLAIFLPRRQSADDTDSLQELPVSSPWYGNEEIKIFRQYLRIPSVHPNINYGESATYSLNW